jgi:S-formylglutathione hydrolase FrmB
MFHVSDEKDNTIIAGLSMGGYGALWCSLRHPDTFGYCGSFSGAIEPALVEPTEEQILFTGSPEPDLNNILGDRPAEEMSINKLFDEVYKTGKVPGLFMTCGTNDFLYKQNKDFSDKLGKLKGIDFTYHEWEGDHEWSFWDKSVNMMLDHIFSL